MSEHIKAWNNEYKSSIWRGYYSLKPLDSCCKRGRLLDAGCGSGKFAIPLRMRGFEVIAVDVSPIALNISKNSSKNRELDIEHLAVNVCQLPFSDASFDVIWCYGVLQHLLQKERELAVSEFERLLRSGGLLFIEVFGNDDMRYGGSEIESATFRRKNGIIYHYFDKNELDSLLKGFSTHIDESRKEKRFKGERFTRHMISAIARKS